MARPHGRRVAWPDRAALFVPRPAPRAAGRADSLRAAQRPDTPAPPPDTLHAAPQTDTLAAPAPPDSTRPRRDSTPPAALDAALPARSDSLRADAARAGRRP